MPKEPSSFYHEDALFCTHRNADRLTDVPYPMPFDASLGSHKSARYADMPCWDGNRFDNIPPQQIAGMPWCPELPLFRI